MGVVGPSSNFSWKSKMGGWDGGGAGRRTQGTGSSFSLGLFRHIVGWNEALMRCMDQVDWSIFATGTFYQLAFANCNKPLPTSRLFEKKVLVRFSLVTCSSTWSTRPPGWSARGCQGRSRSSPAKRSFDLTQGYSWRGTRIIPGDLMRRWARIGELWNFGFLCSNVS